MPIERVALIFDNLARPETTGVYCRRALGKQVEVEHYLPTEMAKIPRDRFDLILAIDDGMNYPLPTDLRPLAYWAIDTHLDFERALRRAHLCDLVFAAQKDGAERLRAVGIAGAVWLPLACDPELHRPHELPKRFDVCFVGNVFPGPRGELLERIQHEFPNTFVGQRYFDDMARTYSESKIIFNRSLKNDLNMRVFEALACGALLVTNDLSDNGQAELFQDGEHLVTYRDADELLDKLRFYLQHDDLRERIAQAGHRGVLDRHTYEHRMNVILEAAGRLSEATSLANPISLERPRKEATYFQFDRPEVVALVPTTARRVLDIGCGGGRLGAAIKQRQTAEVVGIELNPVAADDARHRLDDVIVGNVETDAVDFPAGRFDCVVCADVLEHLREPRPVLEKIRRWLTPGGILVASIPNVRNHAVIRALLDGNWTYESAGLLDQDHVRFFTRREIEKLLFRAGFQVTSLDFVPGEGFAEWEQQGRPAQANIGGMQIRVGTSEEAAEFFAYQFLTTARPERRADDQTAAIDALARAFPWPQENPNIPLPDRHLGWLTDDLKEALQRELSADTHLILELGTWLGQSTRFLADTAPNARVIAIDHWQGSREHRAKPEFAALLPSLYESFLALNWDYRNRVIPLQSTTLDGLRTVAQYGLQPDLVFIDAEHSFDAVTAELDLCRELFPHARIVGDDYDDPGVQRAANEFAHRHGLTVEPVGTGWRAWRLVADPPVAHGRLTQWGLTSIILVTHNQLAYTRQCLDSIRLRTDEPYELIVVDNGSTDGTVDYLKSLDGVTVIANLENRGFPAAANQGLRAARGENLLLLNNDTIVTTGWLRRMLDALSSAPDVGLIGPVSNQVSGEQQVSVSYAQLESLDGFAWDWAKHHGGQRVETDRLVGFCLLGRRALFDRIGLFDEQFGIGNFEDDDLCRRAIQAGYRCLIARDAFVHHFGGRTFVASGVDFARLMDENRQKYDAKWNQPTGTNGHLKKDVSAAVWEPNVASPDLLNSVSLPGESTEPQTRSAPIDSSHLNPQPTPDALRRARPRFTVERNGSPGLRLKPNAVKLSLCMIVRDNENTIGPALESIRPWVDEMIVVDTGSTDRTPEICREYGARLYHFPWCDDFSTARNGSLKYARGEWIFWMDSDDTITPECGRKLRDRADGRHENHILGYIAQVHCPGPSNDGVPDVTVVDHVKLFRNQPELRFEGRIHEQLLPAIRRAGGDVAWTDIYVVHSGSDHSEESRQRKLARDFRLLHAELQEKPDHPFVLFNLGMTYADAKQHDEAIRFLNRCLEVSTPEESHLRKAYSLFVSSLSQAERYDEALQTCEKGLLLYPDDKELLFRSAMLHHHFGRLNEAEQTYLRVLNEQEERHFTSVDQGLATHKARHNLAIVYHDMGMDAAAEREWRTILDEIPEYAAGWRALGELLVRQRQLDQAELLCQQLLSHHCHLHREGLLLRGRLGAARGDFVTAMRDLEAADGELTNDAAGLQILCQLLCEHGQLDAAETALEKLAGRFPDDAATLHNLGAIRVQKGHYAAAIAPLEASLRLRPGHNTTRSRLKIALQALADIPTTGHSSALV